MIYLRLVNGLGNQLFQYAFARYLQEQYKEVMWINIEAYQEDAQRDYSLAHFKLNPNVYVQKGMPAQITYRYMNHIVKAYRKKWPWRSIKGRADIEYKDKIVKEHGWYIALPGTNSCMYYDYPITAKKNKLVIGSFQNEKYFREIKDIVLKEFRLKDAMPAEIKLLMKQMRTENSVCVHMRRGDYLMAKNKGFNICTKKYYYDAMDLVADKISNPVFYIFSNTTNDLNWIEESYSFKYPVKYVKMDNPDYIELMLMAACNHFIISNSTFSWWAQYLAENEEKIVVAPNKWYNVNEEKVPEIYMDTWNVVEI